VPVRGLLSLESVESIEKRKKEVQAKKKADEKRKSGKQRKGRRTVVPVTSPSIRGIQSIGVTVQILLVTIRRDLMMLMERGINMLRSRGRMKNRESKRLTFN
jgi:hypothetical protein